MGKGASDDELVEGSLHLPTPPRHRPRHLPCERLISNVLSSDRIVRWCCLKVFTHLICSICRIFARVLLLVKTAAAAIVPTTMIITPRITVELADPTDWEAAIRSFSLEAKTRKIIK